MVTLQASAWASGTMPALSEFMQAMPSCVVIYWSSGISRRGTECGLPMTRGGAGMWLVTVSAASKMMMSHHYGSHVTPGCV